MPVTDEVNKSAGQEVEVLCAECGRKTHHQVRASFDRSGSEQDGDWSFEWQARYQVIQCLGCKTSSFRLETSNSEDIEPVDQHGWQYAISEELFPSRARRSSLLEESIHYMPLAIQRIYRETIQAINSSSPVLAGVGIRTLIEAVCKEKEAAGNNLLEKIDDLVTKQILTPQGAKTLHKLRILGNAAAHEVKPHNEQQLGLALDVVEHLVEDVYILPMKVQAVFEEDDA